MIPSNDIAKRIEEIQLLIANDNIPQAMKRLIDFVRDFSDDKDHLNEVIVISANYNRLEKVERQGSLPFNEVAQNRNRLLYQALGLIVGIQQQSGPAQLGLT